MNIVHVIEFAKNGSESGGENLYDVWRIGSTSQLCGINLKAPQPQTRKNETKLSWALFSPAVAPARHGLETHGGGWGKAKHDKCDKSGALQGGTVRVRASRSWAHPAPCSEFFYLIGRAANRPRAGMVAQTSRNARGRTAQYRPAHSHPGSFSLSTVSQSLILTQSSQSVRPGSARRNQFSSIRPYPPTCVTQAICDGPVLLFAGPLVSPKKKYPIERTSPGPRGEYRRLRTRKTKDDAA